MIEGTTLVKVSVYIPELLCITFNEIFTYCMVDLLLAMKNMDAI